jgi:Uma2 family endonuclease
MEKTTAQRKSKDISRNGDLFTVDDFYSLVPDGQKADLIDGVIYLASPDTLRSDQITGFLLFLMRGYVAVKAAGTVSGSRFAYRLTEYRAPEPDVAFVSAARQKTMEERGGKDAPDIAVEVVTRDSRQRDYDEKKKLYEQQGVKEYWIIDPLKNRCEFYRLKRRRYQLVPLENKRIFRSQILKGFWLDVRWVLSYPLPNDYECLQQILQEASR